MNYPVHTAQNIIGNHASHEKYPENNSPITHHGNPLQYAIASGYQPPLNQADSLQYSFASGNHSTTNEYAPHAQNGNSPGSQPPMAHPGHPVQYAIASGHKIPSYQPDQYAMTLDHKNSYDIKNQPQLQAQNQECNTHISTLSIVRRSTISKPAPAPPTYDQAIQAIQLREHTEPPQYFRMDVIPDGNIIYPGQIPPPTRPDVNISTEQDGDIVSFDSRLDADVIYFLIQSENLWNYFMYYASTKPEIGVKLRGTHVETHTVHYKDSKGHNRYGKF